MHCTTHRAASIPMEDLYIGKWFSWSGNDVGQDWDGMIDELAALGEAVNGSDGLGPSPLRPLGSLTRLKGAHRSTLVSVSLNVYDVTLDKGSPGTQDVATLTAIDDSLDPSSGSHSVTTAYAASRHLNSVIGMYQPNFVWPRILINGRSILTRDMEPGGGSYLLPDRSIGLDVPWCAELNITCPRISDIEVFCPAGQIVGSKIQRYAVSMELVWNLNDTYDNDHGTPE